MILSYSAMIVRPGTKAGDTKVAKANDYQDVPGQAIVQ